MKLKILFKTPDAGEREIIDWAKAHVDKLLTESPDDPALKEREESGYLTQYWMKFAEDRLKKWIKNGEYITIEFDDILSPECQAKVLPK